MRSWGRNARKREREWTNGHKRETEKERRTRIMTLHGP